MAADAFSSTLLPAHFDAISLCWNEFLAQAPVDERTKLVSFLIQLRTHFPTWRGRFPRLPSIMLSNELLVLSWEAVIETLAEDEYEKNKNDEDRSPTNLVCLCMLCCADL